MKIKKHDGKTERQIVISMIMDVRVVSSIARIWTDSGMFNAPYANVVGKMCVDYFKRYGKAPCSDMQIILDSWVEDNSDHPSADLIEDLLFALNDELETQEELPAFEYINDLASRHFLEVQLKNTIANAERYIKANRIDEAAASLRTFGKVDLNAIEQVDVLNDSSLITSVFDQPAEEDLVGHRGALQTFFKGQLVRDAFVSFVAPDKRGKSFWLLDTVFRSVIQRRKVAYFVIGDMSRVQVMRRFLARATKKPFKATSIKVPKAFEYSNKTLVTVREEREYDHGYTSRDAQAALDKIVKHRIRSRDPYLFLSVHQADMVSVVDLRSILVRLNDMSDSGWTPDVVVIDYADNLAPLNPRSELREQVDKTWAALRGLSQEFHCLVVTATQSNSAAYTSNLLRRSNFSDSKRKNAHVTGMVGINVTNHEKSYGISRLNWIQARDSEFSEDAVVHCAGCLAIANPAMISEFVKRPESEDSGT